MTLVDILGEFMVKGLYECVGCSVQKEKICTRCNRKNRLIKFNFKKNDFVRLSKEAVKNFYGTDKLIDMYTTGAEMEISSESFLSFISHQLGFENGNRVGMVASVSKNSVRVQYFVPELGSWNSHYYAFSDLELVQEA